MNIRSLLTLGLFAAALGAAALPASAQQFYSPSYRQWQPQWMGRGAKTTEQARPRPSPMPRHPESTHGNRQKKRLGIDRWKEKRGREERRDENSEPRRIRVGVSEFQLCEAPEHTKRHDEAGERDQQTGHEVARTQRPKSRYE